VEEVIRRVKDGQASKVNLNNVANITSEQWARLFGALKSCQNLESLSLANCGLTDADSQGLIAALSDSALAGAAVTLDSNSLSAQTVLALLKAAALGAASNSGRRGVRIFKFSNQVKKL